MSAVARGRKGLVITVSLYPRAGFQEGRRWNNTEIPWFAIIERKRSPVNRNPAAEGLKKQRNGRGFTMGVLYL
jgi:hypothetical protein